MTCDQGVFSAEGCAHPLSKSSTHRKGECCTTSAGFLLLGTAPPAYTLRWTTRFALSFTAKIEFWTMVNTLLVIQ